MPHLTIPEDTFRRLSARAAALHVSVEELVTPVLDRIAKTGDPGPETPPPLAGDAWWAELRAWKEDAERRSGRYPPGFVIDDSREAIYREREDAQR